MDDKKDRQNLLHAISVASSAGFTLLVSIAVFLWLGWEFDSYFMTKPWGTFIGGIWGGICGVYSVYRQIMRE